ncbi:hypothetical protein BN938_1463 [Mucinivorans hirudinis]|uniref:WbqC-like protein n=1 Tax=Mucinivorans hirudinis TaxID=1433126 RepID=A0A060R841_9BACT|nr:hypothetical protein BN938_1463 [Mucinivorans hirudinis]
MTLSTAYLPNIQYITKFLGEERPQIEACENFLKQTFRNRCDIMSANGTLSLTVPIQWNHHEKMPIREVRIDNSSPWQRTHRRALTAAYKSSPYFDHFFPQLEPFLLKNYHHLWELNNDLLRVLLRIFKLDDNLIFTSEYSVNVPNDFRNSISPKPRLRGDDPSFIPPRYYQVFADRIPFAQNLSIVDYLFCEGNKLR